jgi:hypothetical protein
MGNDLILYDVPELDADLNVDFMDGEDLESIEDGIRKIAVTSDLLALIQGVAIVRVEREGIWRQGGFDNLRAYRIAQGERLGMPRSTISLRRKTAEGWLDNRKLIGKFALAGHVSKLTLLSEALRKFEDRREVIAHFKADTYREFRDLVRPRRLESGLPDVDLHVDASEISLDGVPMLAFDEDLAAEERTFIAQGLRDLYRARRGNLIAHVVPVYDAGEARAVDNFLKKLRSSK